MNPFDVVPLIPFPEWGFDRYGRDLYLPSIETDSDYLLKIPLGDSKTIEHIFINPQINRELHTVLDYLAFFVNSAASYMSVYQNPIIQFMADKSFSGLWQSVKHQISADAIIRRLKQLDENGRYQMYEFGNFIDYLTQIIYTAIRGQKLHADDVIWDPTTTLQENIAYNHYDRVYSSWLFSDLEPDELFSEDPLYAHMVILGDVDVEVTDADGSYIVQIDSKGNISSSPEKSFAPSYKSGYSDIFIYPERLGDETLMTIPMDHVYSVTIRSNIQQTLRFSYTEFSAEKLHADIRYVYYEEHEKGEIFTKVIDPETRQNFSGEKPEETDAMAIEPWSGKTVYSPTEVMRLENTNVFHPSPLVLLTFTGLILLFVIYIFVMLLLGIISMMKKRIRKKSGPVSGDVIQPLQ